CVGEVPTILPLAFTQLAHWHVSRLHDRPAIRQILSATLLRGRLNVAALRTAIAEMTWRHDALRMRFTVLDGTPTQHVTPSVECALEMEDLTSVPECDRGVRIQRTIAKEVLQPINVSEGPLFGARLVRLNDEEHVLILALEHLISDMKSMSIL